MMSRKNDPDFTKLVQDHVKLDEETGTLTFTDLYANLCLNIGWKGELIVVPYSHVVWLLKHNRWPLTGLHVDHINDYALDNRPINLQEITEKENQAKRRGKRIYRSYGTGKYGYGIHAYHDKRDGRYYVTRRLSRGHGKGDLKKISRSLGGFGTLDEAEEKIRTHILEIKKFGLDYLPTLPKQPKRASLKLNAAAEELRALRANGLTLKEISQLTGLREGAIYSRVHDLGIDNRSLGHPQKLNEDKVRQIRTMRAQGETLKSIATTFGISTVMVDHVLRRIAWAWVE